ncbi:MAG: T9SS type A sorting domain-containing protein [Fluviicola sp.]|jgi:hypothetical protein
MKKGLLSLALLASATVNAQLPANSIGQDFTVTAYQPWLSAAGMNSNGTYNLYDYLDQGYTVFLDVSATWCGPCWNYHLGGALEEIYADHGPAGAPGVSGTTTDDVMVIWIEGDGTTADATMLDGSGAIGNWIEPASGNQIQFPMANPAAGPAGTINNDYAIGYYPTIYKICPNRLVTEVGQQTAANLYASVGTCPPPATDPSDVLLFSYDTETYVCSGSAYTPEITIQNNGTTPLANATVTITQGGTTVSTGTYTGPLSTYGLATVTCTPIASPSSGPLVVTVTTTGDANATNGTLNTSLTIYTAATAPFSQNFAASGFPYAEYTLNSPTGNNWAYSTATMKYDCYNYTAGNTGDFVIEPINLSSISNPRITFDVAHRPYTAATPENDRLEVFISTNCGTTWTSIFNKQGTTLSTGAAQTSAFTPATATDWRNESVSLASYASQNQVFFKFVGTSAYGNNMYVDNINVSSLSSIESNELASSSVYPNPASTEVNVSFEAKGGEYKVSITDLVGRTVANEVVTDVTGTTQVTLSTSDLKAGNYLVTITNGTTTYTQNLMVK